MVYLWGMGCLPNWTKNPQNLLLTAKFKKIYFIEFEIGDLFFTKLGIEFENNVSCPYQILAYNNLSGIL